MKEYEIYSNLKTPIGSRIILRVDGRNFHSLSNYLNLKKPYDEDFSKLMVNVSLDIFKEFSPLFIYTFSDEINILLDNIPFNFRVEKLNSVIPSFAASSFSLNSYFKFKKPVSFDSRIIPINNEDIPKYFKWRQDEAWRNCINSYGIWVLKNNFSNEVANNKIKGLKSSDIHELLFNEGINLNNIETWKKRGIALYKKEKIIEGYNKKENKEVLSFRNYIFKNFNIPIFSNKFFKEIHII